VEEERIYLFTTIHRSILPFNNSKKDDCWKSWEEEVEREVVTEMLDHQNPQRWEVGIIWKDGGTNKSTSREGKGSSGRGRA